MLFPTPLRVVLRYGSVAGAMLAAFPAAPAWADPPNCTAADLAGVAAGVSAATSAYLFTHPDVNDFVTGLKGQPRDGGPRAGSAVPGCQPADQGRDPGHPSAAERPSRALRRRRYPHVLADQALRRRIAPLSRISRSDSLSPPQMP